MRHLTTVIFSLVIAALSLAANADFKTDTMPFSVQAGGLDGLEFRADPPRNSGLSKIGVKKGDIVLAVDHEKITNREGAV